MAFFTKQLLLLVSILQTTHGITSDCIHDEVQPKTVLTANIKYVEHTKTESSRLKRSLDDLYKPMRIHVHYSNLDYQLEEEEQNRLKQIIKETTTKISNILSVIPVKGKLLLSRSERSCGRVLIEGINKNKCSHPGHVRHETCLDNFRIPQEHLQGLFIYNYTHPYPVHVVWEEGAGLQNTDYILYVRSISSRKCFSAGKNVIAYAAYCQVDQSSRPIAGYINICPQLLTTQSNDDKLSIIALHEFFHALGFTSELFDKFRDCSNATLTGGGRLLCPRWHKLVREVLGSSRLVTPRLVNIASSHYDCSTHQDLNEYGPRLQSEFGQPGSHWDAAFLQGSLMAPNIGLPELTRLDPLTLAVFADMGWYKVNFDFAEDYVWGKGEGCSFSNSPGCTRESDFFCKKKSAGRETTLTGCHYLHQHKGMCETNDFLHTCALVQATSQGSCRDTGNQKHAVGKDEKFQPDSRCFVANLTKDANSSVAAIAHCYQHQCVKGQLRVRVGGAPWTPCPYGQEVQMAGYRGFLKCPREGILCVPPHPTPAITEIPALTTPTTAPVTVSQYCPDVDTYNINISFPEVNYVWLESQAALPIFKEHVKSMVAHHMGISEQRISQSTVYRTPGVVIGFSLLPSHYPEDGPASKVVYERLKGLVDAGNLTVRVLTDGKLYTATSISQSVGGPTYYYSPSTVSVGIIAGMVVGSLVAMLVLGGLVFFVQRYYAVHSRVRPNHARALAAQAQSLPPAPGPPGGLPGGAAGDSGRVQWTHERAVSALSASDINMDEDISISDFSDTL